MLRLACVAALISVWGVFAQTQSWEQLQTQLFG